MPSQALNELAALERVMLERITATGREWQQIHASLAVVRAALTPSPAETSEPPAAKA